ncbi:MAG: hypothetical protein ACJ76K_12100, partial [Solirubrobacteraceae bacterium]
RPVLHRYAELVEESRARDRALIESLAATGRQFDPGVVDALEHGVRDESLGLRRQLEPAAR